MTDTALPDPGPGAHPSPERRRKAMRAYIALGVIAIAIGFLLFQGLGNATEYFKTTEEAVAQQKSLGSRRFRLEGIVAEGTVCARGQGGVEFNVEGGGKTIQVHHDGNPPELFRENVPVVLSGSFAKDRTRVPATDAARFQSDLVMIKHGEDYVEKNSERVKDYIGRDDAPKRAKGIPGCAAA